MKKPAVTGNRTQDTCLVQPVLSSQINLTEEELGKSGWGVHGESGYISWWTHHTQMPERNTVLWQLAKYFYLRDEYVYILQLESTTQTFNSLVIILIELMSTSLIQHPNMVAHVWQCLIQDHPLLMILLLNSVNRRSCRLSLQLSAACRTIRFEPCTQCVL